jgi:glycosyltransferase involved in cell wall biosynthesis
MRILFATDHYPPFIGGAHRQAQLLAVGMADRGHDVTVVAPWQRGLPAVEDDAGVEVHRVRQIRTLLSPLVRGEQQRHQPPFPDPVTILALRRLISSTQPDVIHSYGWISYSVAIALGRRDIPLLVSARDYGYFCANRTLLRKGTPCAGPAPLKCLACAGDYYGVPKGWLAVAGVAASRPLLLRKMTGLHSVSSYVHEVNRRFFLGRRADEVELPEYTIPSFQELAPAERNGDDADVAALLEPLPDEPFILFVGAFRKVKGLETLFAAYRKLESPPPLVLMGTYERDAPEGMPAEAIVLTDVPHKAVMAAWDRALFGVMPSLWPEPLGATVSEAMSRGRPVIGTRLGGHADMLGSGAGVLVTQGDVEGLAAAMDELIRDPARREAYGRAAAERAREFSGAAVLPRFEGAYRDLITSGERGQAGQRRTRRRAAGPLRILMLTQSYAPVVGGEERMVEDLSRELTDRGHEVAIATLSQPLGEPTQEEGMRVYTLGSSTARIPRMHIDVERRHAPPAPDPETVLELSRVLREERPDVVHAHNWIVNSYLPLRRRRSGPPLILSMHDYGLICATKRFLYQGACCSGPGPVKCVRCAAEYYGSARGPAIALGTRALSSRVRRSTDVFLPVSAAVRDLTGLGPDDVHRVVPNFIGELPPPLPPDDPSLADLPDQPFVLYVGDVTVDKGARHLAEVHAMLESPPPVALIGRPFLEDVISRPGFAAIGTLGRPAVIEAMRRCTFVVVPSILPETFGLVALEAAAAGKPVIASDIGGLKDVVVDGVTGLLVPPGDRVAWAEAVQRLLADAGLRGRMGEAATLRAKDFSPEVVVPQFEDAYREAIAARRAI